MIDPNTSQGAKASALLDDALVVWLTTVRQGGQPQASPVWFVRDADEFLIYSMPTQRVKNIRANERVALNVDSDAGSDVVTIEGTARIVEGPPNLDHAGYQEKYRDRIEEMGTTPEDFSAAYSVVIRVTPTRWRVY